MRMYAPKPKESGPERPDKELAKTKIVEDLRSRLEELNIGSHTADKAHGGWGEDLFGEPTNFDEIMDTVQRLLDTSIAEDWPRERLEDALTNIPARFDFSNFKKLDDFTPFKKDEEPLGELIDVARVADELYGKRKR